MRRTLHDLPGVARLAVAGFTLLILGFAALAQVNLWIQAGDGSMPTPQRVLERYHGRAGSSPLHGALDPTRDPEHPEAMFPFLGETDAVRHERRAIILAWVEAGATEAGWPEVAPIFTDEILCGQCHYAGGQMSELPFESYEDVLPVARMDAGMPLAKLMISAHNHAFGFAVLALLLSLGVAFARGPAVLKVLLVLAAFAGPVLDIGGWFLTRAFGAPFHWTVMAGGALFGLSTTCMAAWVLLDLARGQRQASGAEQVD